MNRVLFVTSEAHPLVKTGGLADVSGSLPPALRDLGCDIRLLMPAYRQAVAAIGSLRAIATLQLPGGLDGVRLLEGRMPDSGVTVWLLDSPHHYDREGGPYSDRNGHDWGDNAARFALLGRAAADIALGRAGLEWFPDVVHGNDWQSGLAIALLAHERVRPATLFTIHNLAYQGLFSRAVFDQLNLPPHLWSADSMEFYGQLSFLKGGLVHADRLTTVSPTYAEEIRERAFGYGLEGLLRHRSEVLDGILNGADYRAWDPATDRHLPHHYTIDDLSGKLANKRALQRAFGLPEEPHLLIGMVGRIVEQKGLDLLLHALPVLLAEPLQIVLLGSGDPGLERALLAQSSQHPHRFAVRIGYDEALAHRIEAGADLFLMPSRFEPCGLNQIYSLRYGTLPLVRRTGGLADTVVDANSEALATGEATGFLFDAATPQALTTAVRRAVACYQQPAQWQQLMRTAMVQDFSWQRSASDYLTRYQQAITGRQQA